MSSRPCLQHAHVSLMRRLAFPALLSLAATLSAPGQSVPKAVPVEEDERPVPKAVPVTPDQVRPRHSVS